MSWKDDAFELAALVSQVTSVAASETWLTDRLVEFRYVPPNSDAAQISLVVSQAAVIFSAGRGTRAELDGPATSASEVEVMARAVTNGRFSEVISKRHVTFELRPEGLPAISGRSSYLDRKLPAPYGEIVYAPYRAPA